MHQNQFLNFLCSLSRIVIFSAITQIKQSLEFCFVDKKIVNEACLGIAYICVIFVVWKTKILLRLSTNISGMIIQSK